MCGTASSSYLWVCLQLTSDQLKSIFEECGEVKNVQLSMDESQPTK